MAVASDSGGEPREVGRHRVFRGIGEQLFGRRTTQGGADVVFDVGCDDKIEEVWAHSAVVIAASPVMEALLCGRFREAKERRVRIKDVQARHFEAFLEFVYTGSVGVIANLPACMQDSPAVVHVAGLATPLRSWREQLARVGSFSIVLSMSDKKSSHVYEAWLCCDTLEIASDAIARFQSGDLDIKVGLVQVVDAELVLDIAMLLDMYSVSAGGDWVVSQLRELLGSGWSMAVYSVMCKAWNMRGSSYRSQIIGVCSDACGLGSGACWDCEDAIQAFHDNFTALMCSLDGRAQLDGQTGVQVRLQLISWGVEVVRRIEDATELGYAFITGPGLMQVISSSLQVAVDELGGNHSECEPPRKRART